MQSLPRSGRPSINKIDENVSRVRDLLNNNRRMCVRMIAGTLSILKTTVYDIVSDNLYLRKVCQVAPKLLTDNHGINRVATASELLVRVQHKPDWRMSLPASKHGYLDTIWRRNAKVPNGTPRSLQSRRSKK